MAGGRKEDLEIVIGASLDGLAADLGRAARMVKGLAKDVDGAMSKADFSPSFDKGSFDRAAKGARGVGAAFRSAAMDAVGFAGKAAVAGGALFALEAGFSGVSEVLDQVKKSVTMAAELEQTTLAFDVMLGSAEKAGEMVAGLRKLAADTPFNTKDVTAAGRALLAYGIDGEQVIPTLRMLGDVSAAFGKDLPLQQLVNEYGKVFSTQRAYAVELRSMAIAGVPIYEALAKVVGKSVAEVKELGEEGKLGRDQVTQAFIDMTSAGGKFFNMTQRQGQTLAGLWETMSDAFDLVKVKFGQMIIEEAGLKDVVRDLERFATDLSHGIDTGGIRQTIRFVADLAKATAQLSYEFARAGVSLAGMGLDGIAQAFPGIQRAAESVRETIRGLQNFRFDRRQLVETAYEFTRAFVSGSIQVLDWLEKTGDSIDANFVQPLTKVIKSLAAIAALADHPFTGIKENILKDFGLDKDGKWLPVPALPPRAPTAVEEYAKKPLPAADWDVIDEYRERLATARGTRRVAAEWEKNPAADPKRLQGMRELAQEEEAKLDAFLRKFKGTKDEVMKGFAEGSVPDRRPADEVAKAEPAAPAKEKTRLDVALEKVDAFFNPIRRAEYFRAQKEEFKKLGDVPQQIANPLAGLPTLGPFAPLAPAIDLAGQAGARPSGVRLQGDIRPGANDAAKALKERYDPLAEGGKLDEYRKDLEDALKAGKITPEMRDMGWRDAVREVADRVGAGQPPHLANAAVVGTQEDARLLANYFAGNQQQSTDDLLKQIRDILAQKLGKQAEGPNEFSFPIIPIGGWN